MDYKEKIEQLKKSCYGNAPCEIDRERLEAAQIIEELNKYLDMLAQSNANFVKMYEKAITERDSAVNDLQEIMTFYGKHTDMCKYCSNYTCYIRNGTKSCNPKWRGVQKEEQ